MRGGWLVFGDDIWALGLEDPNQTASQVGNKRTWHRDSQYKIVFFLAIGFRHFSVYMQHHY